MNAKTTIILVALVAVLGFFALKSNQTEKSRESLPSGPIFPDLSYAAIADIELSSPEKVVHLVRNPDGWLVATENNFPADTMAVSQILDKIDAFDRKHICSTNADKQATFEVDQNSGIEITLSGNGGQALAHFRMGKNGPDYRSQYIRPIDSDEVFCIPAYLKSIFNIDRDSWRDKAMFNFDQNLAKQLLVYPGDEPPMVVEKSLDGNFTITAPESIAAVKHSVDTMIRMMSNLKCDAFPDTVISLEEAGLNPPLQKLEIKLDDGASYSLLVGGEADENKHFVAREGHDTIYLLTKGRLTSLIPTADTLMDRPEPPPEPVTKPVFESGVDQETEQGENQETDQAPEQGSTTGSAPETGTIPQEH